MRVLRVATFRAGEETASFGPYAKHVEKAARHHFTPNSFGVRGVAHREYIPDARGYEVEEMQIVAEITEVEIGGGDGLPARTHVLDPDHPPGFPAPGHGIQHPRTHPTQN